MTFRIDEVRFRSGVWIFSVKGIDGAGVYGVLLTNGEGRGLYLEDPGPRTAAGELIPPHQLCIPANATEKQAIRLLAESLHRLGWGPEVDQRNRPLNGSADEE